MLTGIMQKARLTLAGLAGEAMARPMNLLVVPGRLETGPDSSLVVFGRDVGEVLAGCGGLLAMNLSAGGRCTAFVRSAPAGEELNALRELGMSPDTVRVQVEKEYELIPPGSLLFFPFPPMPEERGVIDGLGPGREFFPKRYFYESRMLILPEFRIRIDEGLGAKLRALNALRVKALPRSAHAAAAYGSAATGQGRGWYESFVSVESGVEALRETGEGSAAAGTNVFFRRYMKSVLRLVEYCRERTVSTLPGGRTLVLAPHYDDEVIGAGGAIMIQVEKGNRVGVVYLTDGRMGIPGIRDRTLVEAVRRAESARAMDILGVGEVYHMSEPETMLRPGRGLLRKLVPILREFSPEVVLVPWFFDNHVDHVETNRVLAAIAGELDIGTLIAGFEVWTPLVPNLYLDISGFASRKRKALLCFASQLRQVDYMRTAMALGRRRAMESGSGRCTEAFFCLRAGEYLEWVDRSGIGAMKFV